MKRLLALAAIAALAACSGNFSTGTSTPQSEPGLPPVNQGTPLPQTDANGLPIGAPAPSMSPGAVASASYPIDDAKKGFTCPQTVDGYACTLSLNLPEPTPKPSGSPKSKPTASPTPTPTPTPTATPSPAASGHGSASPSPSPTPATITLTAQAAPKDAPKMVHIPANTLNTVALMLVQLTTNADLPVDGWASAQFTLPKSEVDGRGFALQLFQVNKGKHNRVDYKALWTLDKSTLSDTTLTFSFKPPKTKIAKGSTYTLVLYGDQKTASPSSAPSAAASASPAPSLTPPASPSPSSTP